MGETDKLKGGSQVGTLKVGPTLCPLHPEHHEPLSSALHPQIELTLKDLTFTFQNLTVEARRSAPQE